MKYQLFTTHQFDKALKLCKKRGYDIGLIRTAIELLVESGSLLAKYKPHVLHGDHDGEWEVHIDSD